VNLRRIIRSELLKLRSAIMQAGTPSQPIFPQVVRQINTNTQQVNTQVELPVVKPNTPILPIVKEYQPVRSATAMFLKSLPDIVRSFTESKEKSDKKPKQKTSHQSVSVEAF